MMTVRLATISSVRTEQKTQFAMRIHSSNLILTCVLFQGILAFFIFLEPFSSFAGPAPVSVTMEYVAQKAEERAHKAFRPPKTDLPDFLRGSQLDYDKYREIQFRHDQALWAKDKLPFRIEFFHPGYLYEDPVHINEFSTTHVQEIRFVQDFFEYGKLSFNRQIPPNTGYAGFRVLNPLNQPDKFDEVGAFIGASYYRLLGRGQRYGASARGLALDCGETNRPEEFPIFTDWWLGKPSQQDKDLHLFAILDSASCTGAYEFRIRPGDTTVARVEAIIFRRPPDQFQSGDPKHQPASLYEFAPLTSMFWFGAGSERRFDDYRSAAHDSDGLLINLGNGELYWHPLVNGSELLHQRIPTRNVHGFGLLQRDRDIADYQDLFNSYQLAPSIWVEPMGQWGDGLVHLVELSTQSEGLDNIVAFFEPKAQPEPLVGFHFGYLLYWTMETDKKLSENKVLGTHIGIDPRNPLARQIAIDFVGPKLSALAEGVVPQASVSCSTNGTILDQQVLASPLNGAWRIMLTLQAKDGNKDPMDVRCALKNSEETLTETWAYYWRPH
jgi:periplasmic glucans biosynthesis protein